MTEKREFQKIHGKSVLAFGLHLITKLIGATSRERRHLYLTDTLMIGGQSKVNGKRKGHSRDVHPTYLNKSETTGTTLAHREIRYEGVCKVRRVSIW